ncbi:hypothetical protein [Parasedimentitalea denitrificans]|nr:hypothetical protein [Sedimentitalea sp. CY04]
MINKGKKMNRRHFSFGLLAGVSLTACAPAGSINSKPSLPTIPLGKALVVFYRPSAFAGGAIRFTVNHSEGVVGQLTSGSVLYKIIDAGTHTFWAQAISQDTITLTLAAGQTSYVRGDVKMGLYAGRPTFSQVSEAQALRELA